MLCLVFNTLNELRTYALFLVFGEHFEKGNICGNNLIGDCGNKSNYLIVLFVDCQGYVGTILENLQQFLRGRWIRPVNEKVL